MGYVDETRKKEKMISEINESFTITSEDLLNIGISKNYVASIVARIEVYHKEYKEKK